MKSMLGRVLSIAIIAALASRPPVFAHDGLHEQIASVTRRIEAAPRDAALYLERAELQRLHRAPELALLDVDRAAACDPALPQLDFVRGKILLDLGSSTEAATALGRYLSRAPDDAGARFTLATAHARSGAFALADSDYTTAIAKLAQPEPEHYAAHARAVAAMGAEHRSRALAILDAGQARLGVNAALEVPAIDLEIELRNFNGALERIDALARQSERREYWLARRGDVLELAGRLEEARTARNSALEAIAQLPSKQRRSRAVLDLETALRARVDNGGKAK